MNLHCKYRGDIMTKNPLTPNFASTPLKFPRPGCFPSCWHVSGLIVVLERIFHRVEPFSRSHHPTVDQHRTTTPRLPGTQHRRALDCLRQLTSSKPFHCQSRREKCFEKRNHSLQLRPSRANSAPLPAKSDFRVTCCVKAGPANQYWTLLQQDDHGQGPLFRWLAWRHPIRGERSRPSKIWRSGKRTPPVALIRRRHPWITAKNKSVWATEFQETYRIITSSRKTSEGLQATFISKRAAPPARLSTSGSLAALSSRYLKAHFNICCGQDPQSPGHAA